LYDPTSQIYPPGQARKSPTFKKIKTNFIIGVAENTENILVLGVFWPYFSGF